MYYTDAVDIPSLEYLGPQNNVKWGVYLQENASSR